MRNYMQESQVRYVNFKTSTGLSEKVGAEELSANIFILLENPIFSCKVNYGTVVEAIPNENGELNFVRIVRASQFKTRKFLLESYAEQGDFSKMRIAEEIIAAGGTWEIAMGGLAFIHIPKDSQFDLDQFFRDRKFYPTEIGNEN
jgi:hypothetical protein